MKELITRVEELAVQASRDARQIETLQGLLKASQSDLMAELTDAIERKKKIDQLASENAALIVSECGHKKAAREAQEKYEESHRLHSLAGEARNNAQEEVRKLRAEVPLESTREALKKATAKIAELTAQLESAKGEAEEWLKQCHAARRQRDEVKAEARKETQRLSDLCAELQSKHEILLAAQNTVKADVVMVYQIADKLGRNQAESIPEFMERQALRLVALESKAGPSIETLSAELSVRYAEIAELHKWATGLIESPAFAHYHYERVQEYNAIVARINSRPQLDLTATLPTVDWQVVDRNLEQTIAVLNAKVAELEAQGAYATKVASQLGERIAYVQKQSMALETLVMRIKSYRNTEAVQQCALIHQLIDATLETMGTRLTA